MVRDGIKFDYDLPSEIRKYTMFKGESDLDVFQNSNALKMLVETFSDVKDFEAYFSFMEFATKKQNKLVIMPKSQIVRIVRKLIN